MHRWEIARYFNALVLVSYLINENLAFFLILQKLQALM